jgi:hypothetical protein
MKNEKDVKAATEMIMHVREEAQRFQRIRDQIIKDYKDSPEFAKLISDKRKEAQLLVIDSVQQMEGWEQSRDHLARRFGFPDKYKHDNGKCTICSIDVSGDFARRIRNT